MELNFTLENIDQAAKELLAQTGSDRVFAFHGEMGAGKTTFINALCKVLQVKDSISSPTFSIINQYATADNTIVYHMDLYRLKSVQEAIHAGVEDCLFSGNTCFVEWPEKAPAIFPDDTLYLTIISTGTDMRKLSLKL
ncbi:MAG: tRNA (adenosine(37)-N6)-threonylcarbamoyltransferase complex ATPase subunit type 1 TsaE [Ferruginibacter sp.]